MATRPLTAGMIRLGLDGTDAGGIESARGGNAVGEVVTVRSGGEMMGAKHITRVHYKPIELQIGLTLDPVMYTWIGDTLQGNIAKKSGVITWAGMDGKVIRELEFEDAVITEIGFPAADASSKDAGFQTIQLQPTLTRMKRDKGKKISAGISGKGKNWLTSNFRFDMDGLGQASPRVAKVLPFAAKVKVAEIQSGAGGGPDIVPVSVEAPNISVFVGASHAEELYEWHEDFVIAGNSQASQERQGSLAWLSADGKTSLLTVTFHKVGIYSLAVEEGVADAIQLVRAELYVEQIECVVGAV
jgi:phage tail-like protein